MIIGVPSTWKCLKRDGSEVQFDPANIRKALWKCFNSTPIYSVDVENRTSEVVKNVTNNVLVSLYKKSPNNPKYEVEQIQQFIIQQLYTLGLFEAAESYQNYREQRRRARIETAVPEETKIRFGEMQKHFPTDLQIYQFMSKFARWDENNKRRETWKETVYDRVTPWLFNRKIHNSNKKVKDVLTQEEMQELSNSMYDFETSPAMRAVQMAGPALDREMFGIFNCSYLPVEDLFAFPEMLYILMQGTGVGFSCENDYISKLPRIKKQRNTKPETLLVEDSTEGWCEFYHELLIRLFDGYDLIPDVSQIRKKGTRLKTKGGIASGPEPFVELVDFVRNKVKVKQGKYLEDIDVHDICCMTGRIVQVGGVRRAAEISLSDLDSKNMRECKSGNWYDHSKHRSMANNSAVYDFEDEVPVEVFMEEWLSLTKSKSGERGIFNRRAAEKYKPARRKSSKWGVNPCFHPDTRIATENGLERIGDMYGRLGGEKVVVDARIGLGNEIKSRKGVNLRSATQVELTQKQAGVYELITECGHTVVCTANHEFPTLNGRKELKELVEGNTILLQSGEGFFGNWGTFANGFSIGLLFLDSGLLSHVKCKIPEVIWNGSKLAVCGFLSGIFLHAETVNTMNEDNSVSRSIKIENTNKELLKDIQIILLNLGINSQRCENKLLLKGNNVYIFKTKVEGTGIVGSYPNSEEFTDKVKSIKYVGESDVFCLNEPETHSVIANGIVTAQCAEIILKPYGQCNLSMAIARKDDTAETLKKKVRLATVWGKIQSLCTDFHFVRPDWKINAEEERLLGVDITGHADCPLLQYGLSNRIPLLKLLKAEVDKVDIELSKRFNVNRSASNTTVKPGGDSAVFFDCASGVSPRFSQYQIRWVRENKDSPVAKFFIHSGVPYAPAPEAPESLLVFGFPKKSPEGSTLRNDLTALDQFDNWLEWKENWAEHSVSTTIYVEDKEWPELGGEVYNNIDKITGVAFLPKDNGTYSYAPNVEITEAEYNEAIKTFPKLDWSLLTNFEKEDMTTGSQVFACVGDKC